MYPATKKHILFALLFFVSIPLFVGKSLAATNQSVGVTVKVGVCGNNLAEDNEDCDNTDLKGNTCETLGYASGTLTCHPSCSFDTTLCIAKKESSSSDSGTSPSETNTVTTTQVSETPITVNIPDVVQLFDTNGDNKITLSEVYSVTKKWFDGWKQTVVDQLEAQSKGTKIPEADIRRCDVNKDARCDLIDFSVLLYYVGR